MTTHAANTLPAVRTRVEAGRIPSFGPLLALGARSAFILLAQGLCVLALAGASGPGATVEVRNWWPVYGTVADVGCLGLLVWLTRREGIRLVDLVGLVKGRMTREIALGISLFVLIFPFAIVGGGMLAQWLVYGRLNPQFPDNTFMHRLPFWALLYARVLWWPVWSATEEMTYNGYALPRLIAQTGSRWLSVAVVAACFALQHSFLMLAGLRFGAYMFLAFLPLCLAMVMVYLRIGRLLPLIVAHWLMDLTNVWFLFR